MNWRCAVGWHNYLPTRRHERVIIERMAPGHEGSNDRDYLAAVEKCARCPAERTR